MKKRIVGLLMISTLLVTVPGCILSGSEDSVLSENSMPAGDVSVNADLEGGFDLSADPEGILSGFIPVEAVSEEEKEAGRKAFLETLQRREEAAKALEEKKAKEQKEVEEKAKADKEKAAKDKAGKEKAEKDKSGKNGNETLKKEESEKAAGETEETRQLIDLDEVARQQAAKQQAELEEAARQQALAEEAARQQAAAEDAARQQAAAEEAVRAQAAAEEAARQQAAAEEAAAAISSDGLTLVNEARAQAGLGGLTMDPALTALANQRAVEIASSWGHTRPNGTVCFTILDENGVQYRACGENIAAGQGSEAEAVNSWLNSEGHRANILNGAFHKMGIGVFNAGDAYGLYWVQIFTD